MRSDSYCRESPRVLFCTSGWPVDTHFRSARRNVNIAGPEIKYLGREGGLGSYTTVLDVVRFRWEYKQLCLTSLRCGFSLRTK